MNPPPAFGTTPGRLWLVKIPKPIAEKWDAAAAGQDLGTLEDDGEKLRLKVPQGAPKTYDFMRMPGAEVRAFERVEPPPRKRPRAEAEDEDEDEEDPCTGRVLGQPAGTFAMKPAAGVGYRKVCRARMVESLSASRTTRVINPSELPREKAPVVAFRAEDVKRGEGAKEAERRKKMDPKRLRSRLFAILGDPERREPLSLKEINEQLGSDPQPDMYLKEQLAGITARVRVSGRVHYDLKPEYKDATSAPLPDDVGE